MSDTDDDWLARAAANLGHLSQVALVAAGRMPDPTMPEEMPEAVRRAIADALSDESYWNEGDSATVMLPDWEAAVYAAIRAALMGKGGLTR